MGESSKIAWTDHTFNIAWGCVKVSPGCANCYADTLAVRYGYGGKVLPQLWGPKSERRTLSENYWKQPHKWNAAAKAAGRNALVFTSSMCDVFEDHPTIDAERERLWQLIRETPWLTWQILTKRAERIAPNLPPDWSAYGWPNVWLGVSVESDEYAERMDYLREIPAVVRFVSYEPALGPLEACSLRGIHWLIVGGESGPGFRPMETEWAESIRQRCEYAGVSYFFKQVAGPRAGMIDPAGPVPLREYPVGAVRRGVAYR